MPKTPRDPFEIRLAEDQRRALGLWVNDELTRSLNARSSQERDVDYWWSLYEQARTRTNPPWPDAADLTSYLASEKVDALHARVMKTVFVEPICTVEGWGAAADKAPFIEEFHQWKAEEERLQPVIDRLLLQSLVEPRGLIEISEGTEMRTTRKRVNAHVETDPNTGGQLFGEDGQPVLKRDASGQLVTTPDPQAVTADTVIDSTERVRTGPVYRLLPYRDSVILPGHARDQGDIYGYGKRFWRRYEDVIARSKGPQAMYDAAAVEAMTGHEEREPDQALTRSGMTVATAERGQGEKELWELTILVDLSLLMEDLGHGPVPKELKGQRWYLMTVHPATQALLRIQHDDLERSRMVPVILFPRSDRVTEGFSFVGHKLLTIIEEHTAVRNMRADRAAMQAQAPIKRLAGALWDAQEQPWGPRAVIDVRDMRELEPFVLPDVTPPLMVWEQGCERTAERVAGINDVASGQVAQESRTLGEIQMATEQSFVRMDLIVRRFQEALEDIYQIRHAIWKRTLAEQEDGMDAPQTLLSNLEGRGVSIDQYMPDQKVTAQLLEGAFRFKPHGSVETADTMKMRSDFTAALQGLQPLLQAFPQLQQMFSTPQAARSFGRHFLQVFRVPNMQAFLGSPAQDLQQDQQMQVQALMAQMMPQGMPGQMPGMPPGQPGMPTGAPGMPPRADGPPGMMPPSGLGPMPAGPGAAPGVSPQALEAMQAHGVAPRPH